jgi:hypothetical protein
MDTTDTCTFNGDCFKILLMIHQGHKAHPCNYEYFWSHLHPPAVFDCIYPSIVTTLVAFIFKREEGGGGGAQKDLSPNEFNPEKVQPTNRSPAASYCIYLSLVPPIFHLA